MTQAISRMVACFTEYSAPTDFYVAVAALLGAARDGAVTAPHSWHPYGFLQMRFIDDDLWERERRAIRVHIWPKGERTRQDPDWPVHSHAYHLHSFILQGSLINEVYDVTPSDSGESQLYVASYHGEMSRLTSTGRRVSAALAERVSYGRGERYLIPKDSFHVSDVDIDLQTATVVLTTDSDGSDQFVVGASNGPGVISFRRDSDQRDGTEKLIADLAKVLASAKADSP